jgi:hypothetical protein
MNARPHEAGPRVLVARALTIGSVLALLVAAHALVIGGFVLEAGGLRLSARSATSPLVTSLVLAALALVASGRTGAGALATWLLTSAVSARAFAAALAAVVTTAGLAAGVDVAGSADASGYVAEARLLAAGTLWREEPLALKTTPPLGSVVFSPLGFRPAADDRPTAQVPTYAPGLPLVMAIAERLAGPNGPLLVVPIAGALAVLMAFFLGERLGSPATGLAAAVLLASTPAFLFQLLQPMSDVPVTAAWLTAFVCGLRGHGLASGLASAMAVAIRPNLLPLAVPVALLALAAQNRGVFALRWAVGLVPGVALVAVLHTVWYGAPWRSGYGDASELYSAANVTRNIGVYAAWLLGSAPAVSGVVACAAVSALRAPLAVRLVAAFLVLNIAVYLPYATFEEWHYLRFILPGLAAALPAGTALVARLGASPGIAVALAAATLLLGAWQLHIAAGLDVFRLGPIERRYALAAEWVAGQTPSDAVIATAQQSGSIALNAGRSVLRWDLVEPGQLDRTIRTVEASGRPVWLLVESWEQPLLRERHFGGLAALDWPPAAAIASWVPVTIHRAADRARFLTGAHIPTAHVLDKGRSSR